VMLDAMLANHPLAVKKSQILQQNGLLPKGYVLVTVHRAANTDNPQRLANIIRALNAARETVVFPVHPRTRKAIEKLGIGFQDHVRMIEPVGYFDMMILEENARLIATDSGGVQREAYFWGIPCITLRDETEWVETVQVGWNRLVGVDPETIREAWMNFQPPAERPPIFGDGNASGKIVTILENERNS
jgi:UDP-GlcNAc3NAcA epimerase